MCDCDEDMGKTNGLKTGVIVVLLGVFVTAALGTTGYVALQVIDHESRLRVVESTMERIDSNVRTLLEKP